MSSADRKEVMWCVDCGARFTQEEIKGWGCPKCGSQGVPCGVEKDTTVEVNWHELRILVIWAENYAQQCRQRAIDSSSKTMPITVAAIARRLQAQRPTFDHLTFSGEIAALPADLAKAGINIGAIETHGIAKPELLEVNGPGAVGHSADGGVREAPIRVAPDRTSDIRDLADSIHNAREAYLDAFGTPQAETLRKQLLDIFYNDKGGFAPLLIELADRRDAALATRDNAGGAPS